MMNEIMNHIESIQPEIEEYCRRNHIVKLAFFGSVLKDNFRPDSDVDVLVEFEPGHTSGFGIVTREKELSGIIGRQVDLILFREIERSPNYIRRKHILRSLKLAYVA